MQGHTKVALILVFLGVLGIGVYRFAQPWIDAQLQKSATDSANIHGTLRIAVDAWVGYFPLCSPDMAQRMRQSGYLWECVDDEADYGSRFTKLKQNEYDLAVATVDSYLLNGRALDYPSPIVAVLDESKGGDALVAWGESVPNLETLKNKTPLKVAFTLNSPSHHLLKAVASHFDMPGLRAAAVAVPSEGSGDALQKFLNKSVDVAVLWEPDVSRALAQEGTVRLLSTADTQGLIVDVLLASRELVRAKPELLELALRNYFKTLLHYRREPEQLRKELITHYKVTSAQAEILLQGVEWSSLSDNARYWFGLEPQGRQGLVEAMDSAIAVLVDSGDFQENPLPQRDPFRLINSQALQAIRSEAGLADLASTRVSTDGKVQFAPLDDRQWQVLQPVATLKVRPIVFASGAAELTENGQEQVAMLMRDLQHYPHFRLEVRGHTGLRGDEAANQSLSQKRADEVLKILREQFNLDTHRARALGLGSSRPLPQQPGESDRAYNYRLPRVELVLLEEEI